MLSGFGYMRAAIRIAIPWGREQTLREAAEVAATASVANPLIGSEEKDFARRFGSWTGAQILALIPARPSQPESPT